MVHTNKPDRQERYWKTARQDGQCMKCAGDIIQGERIVYDRKSRKLYCSVCGTHELGDDPTIEQPEFCLGC